MVERVPPSQERMHRIFDLSRDLFCIADSQGYFQDVNPAWEHQLGWTREELCARPFLEFIHPDDQAPTIAQYDAQKGGSQAIVFSNRYRDKSGGYRWLEWNATPVGPDGLIYAVARDVTEKRRIEAEVRDLNSELARHVGDLRRLNEELEAFSYSVSHDLRAPLRHIAGFADLLDKHVGASLDEKGRRYLETIRGAAQRMGKLIEDLLAFSRLGRAELQLSEVRLEDVLQRALADVRPELEGRAVDLAAQALPTVRGDPSLLHLVMTNLLSNALKYTRQRTHPRIEIGPIGGDGGEAGFFVRDNGVGFDMKYVDKLFGVFQRLHSADEFEGTGIGLANVRRIVHRHGGRAWAEGALDAGATFYVALPQATGGAA